MAAAPENAALARRRPLECDGLFEGLYRGYRADVYEFSLRLVGKREDAEDVTQVAFLNAYRALARGNAPRKPRAWLLTIAHNVCMRHFRLQQRRPREVQLDPELFASRASGNGPTADEVRSALQMLSVQERSALLLREFQGWSYAEIAASLGLSASAVESLLFRARRSLREELEKAGVTPSVPVRRRRTLGGLLPWPPGLEELFRWLQSLARGGLTAKAAGIAAATVVGTGAVIGTGIVPFGESTAPNPPSEHSPNTLLSSRGLAITPDTAARPIIRASRSPADLPAAPRSAAGHSPTTSEVAQLQAVVAPSPPLEPAPSELEAPSLPTALPLPEPPGVEPPQLEPPSLPPAPSLPEQSLPEPPELSLPPPPELPLSDPAEPVVEAVSDTTEPVVETVTAAAEPPPPS